MRERVCIGVEVPARKTEEGFRIRGDLAEVTLDLGEGAPVIMCDAYLVAYSGCPARSRNRMSSSAPGPGLRTS